MTSIAPPSLSVRAVLLSVLRAPLWFLAVPLSVLMAPLWSWRSRCRS